MNSAEQMFGQNSVVEKENEEQKKAQKYVLVDPTTGLAEPYDSPEELADAKERARDRDNRN